MRPRRLLIGVVVAAAMFGLATPSRMPSVIWNTTASAPIGLYVLDRHAPLRRGDLVAALPAPDLARALAVRGVLPPGVPLIKPVAALGGQTVCRHGERISVDGADLATARRRDRRGLPLPVWQGCRRLTSNQVLLLNPARADSFDGRYFGPLATSTVWGRVRPLWVERPGPGQRTSGPVGSRLEARP